MAQWSVGNYLHYGQSTEQIGEQQYHTRKVQAKLTGTDYPDCALALTDVKAIHPLWSPLWVNGAAPTYSDSWLYGYDAEMSGLHATVTLKYAQCYVLDPMKRPPGDVKVHVVGTKEGSVEYKDVAGRIYPNGEPEGLCAADYIGQPGEEGAHGWQPRMFYVVDVILDSTTYETALNSTGWEAFLLRVNDGEFRYFPAYDRDTDTGILLGIKDIAADGGSELLLTDIDVRPLDNGYFHVLYTMAYDPVRYNRHYWFVRTKNRTKFKAVYNTAQPIASALYLGELDFYLLPGLAKPPSLLETFAPQVTVP